MGKGMEYHRFCKVVKMDKADKYDIICKNKKSIENDLEKQLKRFKSTLNNNKIGKYNKDI